jgi:hypothetical protein
LFKKNKTLPANETSQNSGRDTSTAFRLVRGSLDGTPRLRSDSYEARSTGRLVYVPTRARHPRRDTSTTFRLVRGSLDKASRLSENLRLARSRVGPLDLPCSPTLRQKSEHLMQLPTTSYHHGCSINRRVRLDNEPAQLGSLWLVRITS